ARAQLDQGLALADERERLAEAGLARVQAADDLLDASSRRLVGLRLSRLLAGWLVSWLVRLPRIAYRSRILAPSTPSANLSCTSSFSRAPAAVTIGSPPRGCTSTYPRSRVPCGGCPASASGSRCSSRAPRSRQSSSDAAVLRASTIARRSVRLRSDSRRRREPARISRSCWWRRDGRR